MVPRQTCVSFITSLRIPEVGGSCQVHNRRLVR
uniref:Uncharacterized protein n=1 Tax=Rhizophora mucronata TaxID=61149 RepID=A0A2P2QF82_RHIMU